ncbi:MAG: carbamate kinase [Phototrophicales bacterium]|nr:MAG: carbamate kinase [Phototrophicales bacterium]
MEKTAVVAIGGNSLILDNRHPEVEHQWEAIHETCEHIAEMIEGGWKVIITHGNGPQVGFILRRNELAAPEVHQTPLDLIVADTQGSIGYMIQQTLNNTLRVRGINRSVVTVITQVVVDRNDPAFANPTKPIGKFMSEEEAAKFRAVGWHLVEDAGRGWRRVVPSPRPREIVEQGVVRSMIKAGYVVVACGGGGVPVIRNAEGSLEGVEAVIDKDLASSLLAQSLRADLFVISTGVERVAIHFNTPQQQDLPQMTLAQAHQYLNEGHFAKGSMRPKIEAVIDFIENGGPRALITNPQSLGAALRGETGTWITPN